MNTKTWIQITGMAMVVGFCAIGCGDDTDAPSDAGSANDSGSSSNAGTTAGTGNGESGTGASGTTGSGTDAAVAGTDPSCPPFDGNVQGMDIHLPGCCTPEGKCGVISSISMMCITTSMYIELPANPKACGDDADGGEADGG